MPAARPEAVGQFMACQVRVPIVGELARLVVIPTRSDLLKALSHGP
jgi:hypothetical protein